MGYIGAWAMEGVNRKPPNPKSKRVRSPTALLHRRVWRRGLAAPHGNTGCVTVQRHTAHAQRRNSGHSGGNVTRTNRTTANHSKPSVDRQKLWLNTTKQSKYHAQPTTDRSVQMYAPLVRCHTRFRRAAKILQTGHVAFYPKSRTRP